MTSLLHWCEFDHKAHRTALQAFVCTDPAKAVWDGSRKSHPREWELEVQSAIRTHRPNRRDGDVLWLGFDSEEELAAASAWSRFADPGRVLLQLIAVSTQYRRAGRVCANEAMAKTLELVTADAHEAGASRLLLEARIHRNNDPSKRMCADHGFRFDSMHTDDLEKWAYYKPL